MGKFLLALIWGLVLLISLTGWGSLLERVLYRARRVDWGLRAGWGLAWTLAVGGVLNLTHAISRGRVLIYVAVGALAWAIDALPDVAATFRGVASRLRRHSRDRVIVLAIAAVGAATIVQFAGSAWFAPSSFNHHDDFHAYLAYPNQMLQTGGLTDDPFSERRITSLGGQSFLQTLVLATLGGESMHLVDPGISTLLVLGLLVGLFRERRVDPRKAAAILLVALLFPPLVVNTTSMMSGVALFIALFRTMSDPRLERNSLVPRGLIAGLIGAGILSVKSSNAAAVTVLLAVAYGDYVLRSRSRSALGEGVVAGTCLVAAALPWTIALHRSSGTFLFPFLGRGFHGSAYGRLQFPYQSRSVPQLLRLAFTDVTGTPALAFGALAVGGMVVGLRSRTSLAAFSALVFGAAAGIVATIVGVGFGIDRFTYPFVFAAVVILMAGLLGRGHASSRGGLALPVLIVALTAGVLVGGSWDMSKGAYLIFLRNVASGMRGTPLASAAEIDRFRAVQKAVPTGEPLFTRLDESFLFDFRRNRIYVADWPGSAGPPPGMPLFQGADALARYFGSHSVRYVAYAYATEAGFSRAVVFARLSSGFDPWLQALARNTLDVQDNLASLGRTRTRVFDDGKIFVIDLLSPAGKLV